MEHFLLNKGFSCSGMVGSLYGLLFYCTIVPTRILVYNPVRAEIALAVDALDTTECYLRPHHVGSTCMVGSLVRSIMSWVNEKFFPLRMNWWLKDTPTLSTPHRTQRQKCWLFTSRNKYSILMSVKATRDPSHSLESGSVVLSRSKKVSRFQSIYIVMCILWPVLMCVLLVPTLRILGS